MARQPDIGAQLKVSRYAGNVSRACQAELAGNGPAVTGV